MNQVLSLGDNKVSLIASPLAKNRALLLVLHECLSVGDRVVEASVLTYSFEVTALLQLLKEAEKTDPFPVFFPTT
jgi:hypothetical protein